MDAKDFMRQQIGIQRRIADAVLADLTEDMLNRAPLGTTNTIGTILLHVAGTDDAFVHLRARGEPMLWERDGWAGRIGFPNPPGRGALWAEANAATFPLAPLLDYLAAVRAAFDAYIAGATDDDFARPMPSPFGEQPLSGILGLLIVHAAGHFGEIAALKGAMGGKGLPF